MMNVLREMECERMNIRVMHTSDKCPIKEIYRQKEGRNSRGRE